MLKRSFLLLALLIATTISAYAENVTVQTAQRAAQSFLNSKIPNNTDIHLIDFTEKASFPNFYVFGNGTFNYGQTCTVHASANIGFAFNKWMENGTQVSDQPDYSFTVTGNRSLVAHFYFADNIGENHDAVELFPNPAKDKLYIKGNGINRVTLFNVLGQLVEDHEMEHQDVVMLNVSSLKAGHYVIQIESGKSVVSKVFVKKN